MNFAASNAFSVAVTTDWLPIPPKNASVVSIENNTGADLLVRTERDKETEFAKVLDGKSISIPVRNNSSEVLIKADIAVATLDVNVVTYRHA
jgi:hypothetical protein